MGFFDWITGGIKQIGKTINQAIAGFERRTGIDIPFVGTTLSKPTPKPKPKPKTTPKPTPPKSKPPAPKPTSKPSAPSKPKTYRITLGRTVHRRQIQEIEKQVGTKVKVVPTKKGEIAVEFKSPKEIKEVKITPLKEIRKQEAEEKLRKRIEEVYEKASPLEKAGLHAHAFFSGKGLEYVWSWLPGGKTPEQVVQEKMLEAYRTPTKKYVVKTAIGSLIGSPPGIIGTSYLAGAGAGAVVGKVAPTVASKVPTLAKVGTAIAKHPTATKVVTGVALGGVEAGKGAIMYKTLKAQEVPEEEIREKIGAEISRDVLAMVGFGYGFKYGLEKTLPKTKFEVVGRRTKEARLKLVAGREEGIPEGKVAVKYAKQQKWIEPTPTKEWVQAVKRGKIVEETPDYVIKQYKGYEYLISKRPTGLPTKKPEGELIETLRGEKVGYLKLGVMKSGRYKGMEVFVRKGVGIPVERFKPPTEEFKPTVYKPKGKPRPVLKELVQAYKEAEASRIAKSEAEQLRAIEKATEEMVGAKTVEKIAKSKPTQAVETGLKLISGEETGFVPLEPIVSPVAIPVEVSAEVPFITPALITPTLIPKGEVKVRTRAIQKQKLKVGEITEQTFKPPAPTPIQVPKPKKTPKITPPIIVPKIEETPKITTATPEKLLTPTEEVIVPTPKPPTPTPTEIIPPFTPPPILFPELPKGGLGEFTQEDLQALKQMTKYEPSLLGILLGKKRKKKKGEEFFTGFEIRGI